MMAELLARAKVNLCLHVGHVRDDGLHDLFSLTAYPMLGDLVSVAPADDLSLVIDGPFADELADLDPEKNLVMRAARSMQAEIGTQAGAVITLTKRVPAASGIGGGTADMAATLILLRGLWQSDVSDRTLMELSFRLGADGPLCLWPYLNDGHTAIATGAGEHVANGPQLPPLWMALVNPRQSVPTGLVFQAFDEAHDGEAADRTEFPAALRTADEVGQRLAETRNDLARPATGLCAEINTVTAFLAGAPGCVFTRMSGSGATCYGLFADPDEAGAAARAAQAKGWWADSAALQPDA